MRHQFSIVFCLTVFAITSTAQSGGSFTISQAVVANGGGNSAGGMIYEAGTVGQALAGTESTGGTLALKGGFWHPGLVPTAAGVSISGRVTTPTGAGLVNARVSLLDSNGGLRQTITGPFGYYRFDDVESGETYVVSVASKLFRFEPRFVSLNDEVSDLDFIGALLN